VGYLLKFFNKSTNNLFLSSSIWFSWDRISFISIFCGGWVLLDTTQFLQKEKSQKIIEYLKKGYTHNEISKILQCSPSTIQKVKGMVEGWNRSGFLKILPPLTVMLSLYFYLHFTTSKITPVFFFPFLISHLTLWMVTSLPCSFLANSNNETNVKSFWSKMILSVNPP